MYTHNFISQMLRWWRSFYPLRFLVHHDRTGPAHKYIIPELAHPWQATRHGQWRVFAMGCWFKKVCNKCIRTDSKLPLPFTPYPLTPSFINKTFKWTIGNNWETRPKMGSFAKKDCYQRNLCVALKPRDN